MSVNEAGGRDVDAGRLLQIDKGRLRHSLGCAEGGEQRALASRADAGEVVLHGAKTIGLWLLCLSAILTLYTGWDYLKAGLKHVTED